jgi:hypothetical protein
MYYAMMFIIPALVWIGVMKVFFHIDFSWKEMALQVFVTLFVVANIFALGSHSQTVDTMFQNGIVTELDPEQQNCPWGWNDFRDGFCTEYTTRQVPNGQTCITTNGRRSCTTNYKTQYNYIYPWERRYFVRTTLRSYEIPRVDRQGVNTPERFAQVEIGDPVAIQINYTNYIRGASSSLFNEQLAPDEIPPLAYPRIRDYYMANRVIITGTESNSEFQQTWNEQIARLNSNIRETGANVIVVVTGESENFSERLAQAWEAHNINDVIVVIGVNRADQDEPINWVDVRSWSEDSIVNIRIRDGILDNGTLDTDQINTIIETAILEDFVLQSMEEFEYLADDIPPPTWAMVLAAIFLLIVTPGLTYIFNKHEIL